VVINDERGHRPPSIAVVRIVSSVVSIASIVSVF